MSACSDDGSPGAPGGSAGQGGGSAALPGGGSSSAGDGAAPEGDAGEAGIAGETSCQPRSCADLGACGGQVQDGCGHVLECAPCGATCAKTTAVAYSRAARSAGFSGTDQQYTELYAVTCSSIGDCAVACAARGGSAEMCAASECVMSSPNYCLPATAWSNLEALSSKGEEPSVDGATLVLVALPYHDALVADHFQLALPADARIEGIEVTVRRAADNADAAVDDSVRLIKGSHLSATDLSSPEKWRAGPFSEVTYGGASENWGETWTAADLNQGDFGVSLSARYTQTAGNARAYVDLIAMRVHYRTSQCD
ncbi:MAG TPA: hypothetical protein VFK05_30135 [Polyangiaceae bacterium]|nr:hypothetical protein [Polyangiaceae bacterium]